MPLLHSKLGARVLGTCRKAVELVSSWDRNIGDFRMGLQGHGMATGRGICWVM